jgi:hypothetical protein
VNEVGLPALVECHSGYRYAQRPVAFSWQGVRKVVEAVLDQWLTPEVRGFRVITPDQQIFELYYAIEADEWQVIQP